MSARTRLRTIVGAVMISCVLSSCFTWRSGQITVAPRSSTNVLGVVQRRATDQLEALHFVAMRADGRATLKVMDDFIWSSLVANQWASVGASLSGISYFFDPVQEGDFEEAMRNVRGRLACVAMDRGFSPLTSDRHNWTFRNVTDGRCNLGTPFSV